MAYPEFGSMMQLPDNNMKGGSQSVHYVGKSPVQKLGLQYAEQNMAFD